MCELNTFPQDDPGTLTGTLQISNPHIEIVTCDIYGLVSKRPGSPGRFFYACYYRSIKDGVVRVVSLESLVFAFCDFKPI